MDVSGFFRALGASRIFWFCRRGCRVSYEPAGQESRNQVCCVIMNRIESEPDGPEKMGEHYIQQCGTMLANALKWKEENPHTEAVITYHFPPDTTVIGPISDGVEQGFVRCNEAGLSLIKALWPWDDRYQPTINMVRAVLDALVDKVHGSSEE